MIFKLQISPGFKRTFSSLLKKRGQKHPFERVPTPYQVYTWMGPQPDHQVDYIRAEDGMSLKHAFPLLIFYFYISFIPNIIYTLDSCVQLSLLAWVMRNISLARQEIGMKKYKLPESFQKEICLKGSLERGLFLR